MFVLEAISILLNSIEYTNGELISSRVLVVIKKIGIDRMNKIFVNIFKVFKVFKVFMINKYIIRPRVKCLF